MNTKKSNKTKARRIARIRAKISGTSEKPRLSIFRSNKFMYAQLIDDAKGATIAYVSSSDIKKEKLNKVDQASKIGEMIGAKAIEKGVKAVVFDKRGYRYHGRVKAVAEGARKAGLQF